MTISFTKIYVEIWINGVSVMHLQKFTLKLDLTQNDLATSTSRCALIT